MHIPVNWQALLDYFTYDAANPLLFNSGVFFWMFLAFMAVYALLAQKPYTRTIYISLFSVYFYYKSSGWYFLLMLGTSVSIHYLAQYVWLERQGVKRKIVFVLGILLSLGLLIVFKYGNFLLGQLGVLFSGKNWSMVDLFLPLGISFYTFELISYLTDVYRKQFKPVNNLLDFVFYISFFPHLVAGPIVRPHELFPQIRSKLSFTHEESGRGMFLIIGGLVKKSIISDYIGVNFVDRIFENPTLYSATENLLGVYGYTLQIYCDFSGYTDMAMGIALLMGFHLPNNFNRPYLSHSITDFWRRWHISLSSWLRDYLYIPLGGNRKGKFRQYLNLIITMFLGGLWHGASWKFAGWGLLHGGALAIDKLFEPLKSRLKFRNHWFYRFLSVAFTFHFVAFCWIFFRATDFQQAITMILRIANGINFSLAANVMQAYPQVFFFMALGYLLHLSPTNLDSLIERTVIHSPFWLRGIYLALTIWCIYQVQSAAIQPFIYFQF
jgi:alginate O-acetyltransferase complex protein AlgI